jgi:hypothetical protein
MYLCYVDESGTSDLPGNSSHFVLAGISIPIWNWKSCDQEIDRIKRKYDLCDSEIHIAWILRPYLEQTKIDDFVGLNYDQRRSKVEAYRKSEIFRLQRSNNPKLLKQTKKNYLKTDSYVHLAYNERRNFIIEVATAISKWRDARLFAECVDKVFFDPSKASKTIDEQAFEQLVSRFEQFLQLIGTDGSHRKGLIIHDHNQTVSKKLTDMMKRFHQTGTLWTSIDNIIETPLFVDSQLTSMVQIADVCAYALRRYLENGEEELFDLIFSRADRKDGKVVGVRHFTNLSCSCKICRSHRKSS